MSTTRIQTGDTEPIALFAVNAAGNPLTGLTDLYVRVRRVSDGFFLDWTGPTFKNSGWTTLNKAAAEVSAANAPGLYEVAGGLNTGAITNVTANDDYQVIPVQTPGTTARLPGPGVIGVGKWTDNLNATVSSRATQAQILSDATPFQGARIDAAISTRATQAQILSDATPFQGARIDAAISSRATQAQILSDATPFQGARIDAAISSRAVPSDVQAGLTAQGYTVARAPKLDALDANVSTRATQAQILSDAIPFAGADVALTKTAAQAVDARLPVDPADESVQLTAHGVTQAAVAALNNMSPTQVSAAVWDAARTAHAAAGSFGESTRLNAAGLQTDAATEIRDAILSDGTRFAGANIARLDANVSSRAVSGDAMDLIAGAVDASALDVTAVTEIAGGVLDEALAGHLSAGTAGQALSRVDVAVSTRAAPGATMGLVNDAVDSATLATSAAVEIAGKVWDELLAGHASAGTAGEATARLDAAVTTRAAPGASMALTTPARDAIVASTWDEPLAGHLGVGTTGKALQDSGAVSDPAVIAAAVWNETALVHVSPGTMGQLENRLDANMSTRAAPGDPMALQANAVDATSLAASGATKVRDTILSDATPFPGARIDAAISSRAVPGDAMSLSPNAVTATAVAASGASKVAGATWDEGLAGHGTLGTAGEAQQRLDAAVTSRAVAGAQMGLTPAGVAAATAGVWDEALAGHLAAGSAGKALQGAGEVSNIQDIVNGVWDELRAGHVAAGSMGQAQEAASGAATQVAKIDSEPTVDPSLAVPGSLLDRLCNKDASRTFTQATDSLEGIRDRIG